MTDEHIPDGPFTQASPQRKFCGIRENHGAHTDRRIEERWSRKFGMWSACPGWETTHTVTVTAADGTVVGVEAVDLRMLDDPRRYLGTNTAEVVMTYEARKEGRQLREDELVFGAATHAVAPLVCPHDCDRCHEHLYQVSRELEDALEGDLDD